jgi:hypothetical protein
LKTINIKKDYDFSARSNVFIHIGQVKTHLNGFGSISIPIDQGNEIFASHLWTKSKRIRFENIEDGDSFTIKPKLSKLFAFVTLLIFAICLLIFLFTKYRFSFVPLLPILIYVLLYISVLKNRYLRIIRNK